MEGVVSVFPNTNLKLETTTSWDFMGFKEGKRTKRNPTVESDIIIGVIDNGVTPESESFSDKGFGPPPKKWKSVCAGGKNFTCNNKLIGARDYTRKGGRTMDGHGTHTASTAAGNAIADIRFFGLGNGTVRGGVPASRIATYNVCTDVCNATDILAGFDDAIADGVDLITISMGVGIPETYEKNPVAIGAFHAMAKGILTVNSAGNNGPDVSLITSLAPWVLTVAASNTNRGIVTKVVLGDGKTLVGKSVNTFDLKGIKYPLVYGKSAGSSTCDEESIKKCRKGCLDQSLVKGKIVLCDHLQDYDIDEVQSKGVVAVIVVNPRKDHATISPMPLSVLSQDDFDSLLSYMNSTKFPQATVLKSEAIYNQTAPKVASFSSRCPNVIAVDLLKPDITAPGVEILAAFSPAIPPTESDTDTRRVRYSILSGTSMACPHVAGVAAYVKTFNPKWSPSMIHSAIMTTAWPMNATGTDFASTEFSYGAGHVNPIAATNPGLVYEMEKADHIAFLCGLNYTEDTLKLISGDTITCTKETKTLPRNLNYPSMSAQLSRLNDSLTVTFNRTVTNVGVPNSTYKSKVVINRGSKLSVEVTPS
ncbi:Subtilisin-like protease SBT4.13 [Cardamine amara subsp. amara]|uniref:Subtilisin-like protease SBT4.13 n=1 Tax=Cardamine amara subsp. amara TaxID=228776 RepID=A0ABD1AWP6_CARAN